MNTEQLAKEFDRQVGKKQRLEDELDRIASQLHALLRDIAKVRREI